MDRFCDAKTINKSDGTKIKICDGASNLDELREKLNIYILGDYKKIFLEWLKNHFYSLLHFN